MIFDSVCTINTPAPKFSASLGGHDEVRPSSGRCISGHIHQGFWSRKRWRCQSEHRQTGWYALPFQCAPHILLSASHQAVGLSTTGLQITLHATRSPITLKIFISLHYLIDHVVKGGYGIVARRSLLFYCPRTLSKVSLRCAVSQLDMPSTIMRSPVLFPEQQDTFLLLHGKWAICLSLSWRSSNFNMDDYNVALKLDTELRQI